MEKPRILSVDDEPSFTELLKQYFEPRGYAIDIASEGMKALELLDKNEYDVALLDFKMPGVNGEEVMKKIQERGLKTKIIFITAYTDSGKSRERLLGEGAYGMIEKPVTSLKDLEDLVVEAASSEI